MFDKIISFLLNKKYIKHYPIVSGFVMAMAFNTPPLWFLGFFGMVPLFIFLYQENLRFKKVFWNGMFFGSIFMGSVLSWFWSTYPLEWAGIENNLTAFSLILIVWAVSSIFFALFIAAWTVLFYKFRKNNKESNLGNIFFASSLWIIFEYIRAFAFSLLWISPVSLTGAHWTFGFLGYIFAENTLILSLASIGGIYLLGFIVVLINISLYYSLFNKSSIKILKKSLFSVLFLFIILFAISSLSYTFSNKIENGKKLEVVMIDTYLPSLFKFDKKIYEKHVEKIKRIIINMKKGRQKPDIIVLPEDSRFISSLSDVEKELISKNILQKETLFIDSSDSLESNRSIVFKLEYYNTENGSIYSNKAMLVPFGEYLPYIFSYTVKMFGNEQLVKDFNNSRGFSNGKNVNNAVTKFQSVKIGALFCSEIVSNNLYGKVTKQGANVLVNLASHSVFKGSLILRSQTTKMAKVHAVQNNRYFIQSMNFAPSFILDNKGVVIAKSKNTDYGVTSGSVVSYSRISMYNKLGNWVLFISLIVVAIYTRKYLYRLKI